MNHDCVPRINALLAEHNTQLACAISFSEPTLELILVATVKLDGKARKKPQSMFASFCPFCGVNLNPKPPATDGYPQCDGEDSYE